MVTKQRVDYGKQIPALNSKGLRPDRISIGADMQTNTSPEFKGIKTPVPHLWRRLGETNTSPEFKGIKTPSASLGERGP